MLCFNFNKNVWFLVVFMWHFRCQRPVPMAIRYNFRGAFDEFYVIILQLFWRKKVYLFKNIFIFREKFTINSKNDIQSKILSQSTRFSQKYVILGTIGRCQWQSWNVYSLRELRVVPNPIRSWKQKIRVPFIIIMSWWSWVALHFSNISFVPCN